MNRSFYNGVAGTKSYQYGLDTLANNIANVNTPGFKGRNTEFSTLFEQTLQETSTRSVSSQVGLGSRVGATALDLTQGSLVATDNTFDLAIGGDGWFAIQRQGETFFTRNGSFFISSDNYLTDGNGGYVQGFSSNAFSPDPANPGSYIASLEESVPTNASGATQSILLPQQATLPGRPTENATFKANLNPEPEIDITRVGIDPQSYTYIVDETAQTFSISGKIEPNGAILDPKPGDTVDITLTNAAGTKTSFLATLDENLEWSLDDQDIALLDPQTEGPIKIDGELITTQPIPNSTAFQIPIRTTNGESALIDMQFEQVLPYEEDGSLWNSEIRILQYETDYDPQQTYDPQEYFVDEADNKVYKIIDQQEGVVRFNASGALVENSITLLDNNGTPLNLDLGTPYDPQIPNSGYDGLTSLANVATASSSATHDGYAPGDLTGYTISSDGTIYANFSNGKSTAASQLPIFHFQNDQGLQSSGDVYFQASANSGKPLLYTDDTGEVIQGSVIYSNMLESSNVSLNTALTEMIVMQKAFDANAKSITTSDQMIKEAINMKK